MAKTFDLAGTEFLDTGSFTHFVAEVVQFSPTDETTADNLDLVDTGGVNGEHTLHALTGLNPADSKSFLDTGTAAGDPSPTTGLTQRSVAASISSGDRASAATYSPSPKANAMTSDGVIISAIAIS